MPDQPNAPVHYFVPPRIVRVSEAGLARARAFGAQVRQMPGQENAIVTFTWGPAWSYRVGPDDPVVEVAAGVDIGAHQRSELPKDYAQRSSGVEFAIQIPPWIYEKSPERLIDVDPASSRFVLR